MRMASLGVVPRAAVYSLNFSAWAALTRVANCMFCGWVMIPFQNNVKKRVHEHPQIVWIYDVVAGDVLAMPMWSSIHLLLASEVLIFNS